MKTIEKILNLFQKNPNYLTMCRIVCVPILIILLSYPGPVLLFFSGLVFTIASITDYLDGYYARKNGSVSNFGKIMDPLADKLLMSTVFIMLASFGKIPPWIACVIIGRELAITGIRTVVNDRGVDISASKLGKYKTAFQIAAAIPLILHYSYLGIDMHVVGSVLIWMALFFTIWSGVDYFFRYRKYLSLS